MFPDLLGVDDPQAAAARLEGIAVKTPLLENPDINRMLGGRLLIKAEPLQITGSFKFRGAYNRISLIDRAKFPGGVVAWSSGNHGQGAAAAARMLGMPALIVMPLGAPKMKVDNTRALGAEVVFYDRVRDNREEIGRRLAAARGAVIVPPYDDPHIIAGQGTVGLEIAAAAKALGVQLDALLVPCGGGGLTAGCATALAAVSPNTQVIAVEPEGFDDTARSLAKGARLRNARALGSICDSLLTPEPGLITFEINRRLVKGAFGVSDAEVCAAMRLAYFKLKLVVEPGGAVALAAVLAGKVDIKDRVVAVVLSGGNVDPALFCACIEGC
jgi:threonine dehydratase